ncbi:MAG: hypothetical protein A3H70_03535 [Candidatus Komeilibacteria bacterium RIFCSPLOWO2_02_FULL_48_11]|uniref:Uncharacterized protein n=1 Tax=Candidatus Komeilibacteria bacterium RIFCSPLOWO2_02_FULL_48_11 TaxID=1798553 RepID=A0A1G2BT19_9BACT|nr:MAG: hypothetical protein A3H70_03535 [Candidatus Komeilibacteria bacterium RIFCSPLOWO2_02_FULL_48_11]
MANLTLEPNQTNQPNGPHNSNNNLLTIKVNINLDQGINTDNPAGQAQVVNGADRVRKTRNECRNNNSR